MTRHILIAENQETGFRSVQVGNKVLDVDVYSEIDMTKSEFQNIPGEDAEVRNVRFFNWYASRLTEKFGSPISVPVAMKFWKLLNDEEKKITDFFFPKPDSSTDSGSTPDKATGSESPSAS